MTLDAGSGDLAGSAQPGALQLAAELLGALGGAPVLLPSPAQPRQATLGARLPAELSGRTLSGTAAVSVGCAVFVPARQQGGGQDAGGLLTALPVKLVGCLCAWCRGCLARLPDQQRAWVQGPAGSSSLVRWARCAAQRCEGGAARAAVRPAGLGGRERAAAGSWAPGARRAQQVCMGCTTCALDMCHQRRATPPLHAALPKACAACHAQVTEPGSTTFVPPCLLLAPAGTHRATWPAHVRLPGLLCCWASAASGPARRKRHALTAASGAAGCVRP